MLKQTLLAGLGLAMSVAAVPGVTPARAEYPEKPITMIVPWSAGGSTDQTARVLAKAAEAHLGQPIVIINRPGASTTIGLAELAKAVPDGYTIGTLSSTSYMVALQGRQLPFDPIESFSFVSYYGDNLIGIAVLEESPFKTIQDLIEEGKKSPGKLKFGTAAFGSTQHLTTEALQKISGAKFVHVPYNGSAASIPALLGKQVDFITEVSTWVPFMENKQVRVLAMTTPARSSYFPDIPTLKELGYQSLRSVQAILGPAGMPEPIRAKLEGAFRKALSDTAFKETMKRLAMEIVDLSGPDAKKLVQEEYDLARRLNEELKNSAQSQNNEPKK